MSADTWLAAELAERAGQLLLDLREQGEQGSELGRRGDKLSNSFLLERLAAARPEDAVLSEESADHPGRLDADRVWIIDPLDGTREYGLPGRADWAVHVALWERGREITAAAVALPALNAVHASDGALPLPTTDGPPAGSHGPPAGSHGPPRSSHGPPRILVSDSRPPVFAGDLAAALDAELVPMGSAGAKAMAVLRGNAEAYVHAGGQYEWDSAAPVGVVLAAGLHASRIDGSPLNYNQPRPYLPDLLICRAELAGPILDALRHCSR